MEDSVLAFYDDLADSYHLIYEDWKSKGIPRQGEELARLIRAQARTEPKTILDCSCGIGTQAIGLALQGYVVHGTDLSPRAVERASREAAELGVEVDFGVADFRTLEQDVEGSFDVVLSCDNSLPHLLTDDDLLLAARNMWSKLEPGGLLVVGIRDYDEMEQSKPSSTTPRVYDSQDGRRVTFQLWDWSEDRRTYTMQQFIMREVDGRWETCEHTTRYRALLRGELSYILTRAGFSDVRWHLPKETGHFQPLVTARRPLERAEKAKRPSRGTISRKLLGEHQPRAGVYSLAAAGLLILGTLSFLLQAYAGHVDARPGFVGGCTAVALATLLLATRSTGRRDYDAATPWMWFALPFVLLLMLLVLPFIHLSFALGLSSCDALKPNCQPPTLGYWLALVLYLCSAGLTIAAVRASRSMR